MRSANQPGALTALIRAGVAGIRLTERGGCSVVPAREVA